MKIGSLFDGSGGFPLAASMCGIEPVWAAEIEPYPIAVTKSRFPNMRHLGDVGKANGGEVEPVDVITFGSPCQDLSVAGKRAGLKHEENGDDETTRSGLFMEAVRIIKEMRRATNGKYPTFAVWENVPGAFSSSKGEDFRIVLEELIKIVEPSAVVPAVPKNGWPYADCYIGNGWSIAYRVFDAQFWGVPQRRRRIYLVADFRGESARKILFERQGLRGNYPQSGTQGKGIASDAERGVAADDRERKSYGIVSKGNGEAWAIEEKHTALSCGGGQAGQGYPCIVEPIGLDGYNAAASGFPLGFRPENVRVYDEVATTLCNGTRPGFTTGVIVGVPQAFRKSRRAQTSDDVTTWLPAEHANTLNTFDIGESRANELVVESNAVAYSVGNGQLNQIGMSETCNTLDCMHDKQAVLIEEKPRIRYIVRRLTPTECSRLQGFPDKWGHPDKKDDFTEEEHRFWLDVRNTHAAINGKAVKDYTKEQMLTWYNKLHTDSAEYKMWGNGIALPCALYVMQGIKDTLEAANE